MTTIFILNHFAPNLDKDDPLIEENQQEPKPIGGESRVAASEEYHVLVRGSNKDNNIVHTTMGNPTPIDHSVTTKDEKRTVLLVFKDLTKPHPPEPNGA